MTELYRTWVLGIKPPGPLEDQQALTTALSPQPLLWLFLAPVEVCRGGVPRAYVVILYSFGLSAED